MSAAAFLCFVNYYFESSSTGQCNMGVGDNKAKQWTPQRSGPVSALTGVDPV